MKLKNTLILLGLAVGLFAFIHFFESGMPTTLEALDRAGRVVEFDREKIERPALALLLLATGRTKAALPLLDGPGVPQLASSTPELNRKQH